MVADVSLPDFDVWSKRLTIFWNRPTALKPDDVVRARTSRDELVLLSGDTWKITFSSCCHPTLLRIPNRARSNC